MADTLIAPANGATIGFDLVTLPDGTTSVFVARSKIGFGVDGSYADVTGTAGLPVAVLGTVPVSGAYQATQPISATALPLPTGAGTEATNAAILAKIVSAPALDASVSPLHADLAAILAKQPASPALDATVAAVTTAVNAVTAKLIAAPATAAAQASILAATTAPVPDVTSTASLNATLTTSALPLTPNGFFGGAFDVGALAGGAIVSFEQLATATSTTWDLLNVVPLGGGDKVTSTATAGRYEFIAGGVYQVRVRVSTTGSGTITVSAQLTAGQKLMRVFNTSPANLLATMTQATTVSDGSGNTVVPVKIAINASAAGATVLLAAQTGKKIRVLGYSLVCTVANSVKFQDGTTDLIPAMAFAANGGIVEPRDPAGLFADGTVNTALNINLLSAGQVSGRLTYVLV